jgi:hypothetical protein
MASTSTAPKLLIISEQVRIRNISVRFETQRTHNRYSMRQAQELPALISLAMPSTGAEEKQLQKDLS